jgi:hypothetical protein
MRFAFNMLLAASVVSVAAWLSRRFPIAAGFIVALPLNSLMVLPFSYVQHGDVGNTMLLAKSIFAAIPVTMAFFLPFLFAGKLGLSFWQAYGLACLMLCVGFLVHRAVVPHL